MHVYKVEVDQRSLGYYMAESKNQARSAALKHVTVERIDSGDVVALMQAGIAIIAAKAPAAPGDVVDAEFEAPEFDEVCGVDDSQEVLPFDPEEDDSTRELGG